MNDTVKIAAVQMDPVIGENKKNLDRILSETKKAAANGARLVAFPECALTGYVFPSRDEARPYMETVPGPSTNAMAACCADLGVHIVVGMLEKDGAGCFNVAVLVGPKGLVGKYRKIHLPFLGIDRYLDRGDRPFEVYKTPIGNIGMHICYDCNFPENARVMALMGADILVLPTNWPQGRGKVPKYVVNTRAYENKVHFVAVDRVGHERGTSFIGTSKIVDAMGDTVVQASTDKEETIYAEVNLADARQKKLIFKPGEFEMNFIADRRPEMYGKITEANKAATG